jgi:hypothetical protein
MPKDRQLQTARRALGQLVGRQVTLMMAKVRAVDTGKRTVDVQAEGVDTLWKGVVYQPVLRDDEDGVVFDPAVDAWVLVAVDKQGRRRVLGPPSTWTAAHIVSTGASVRVDVTQKKIDVQITGGARVEVDGDEVVINNGTHPAVRGDTLRNWLLSAVPSGPSGPLTPPCPENVLNNKVRIN